mmetsp:Transcript_87917/g.249044  ORF Transcript_87917/g.249044 Transcript_87917/m.249044 type:complete len:299 (+) Transcript_87917:59-955(+)
MVALFELAPLAALVALATLPGGNCLALRNSSGGPSTSPVHVLQFGDDEAFLRMKPWVETVVQFAELLGYEYHVAHLPSKQDWEFYHFHKPLIINETLAELPEGDWLLVLDLDVAVDYAVLEQRDPPMTSAEVAAKHTLPEVLLGESMDCIFMAQDGEETVHGGILVFRAEDEGRKLAHHYANEMKLLKYGSFEQQALNAAVMRCLIPYYAGQCSTDFIVEFKDLRSFDHAKANLCYNVLMNVVGLPYLHRNLDRHCLLDQNYRLNIHEGENHRTYRQGDLLYHGWDLNTVEAIKSFWP